MAVRWRLREVQHDDWWAIDEDTGTAYAIDGADALALWARDDLVDKPLQLAIALARKTWAEPATYVDLGFVGVTVRYRSAAEDAIGRVASEFAGTRPRLRSSPDIIVDVGPDADVDRLYRCGDGPRPGVVVRDLSSGVEERGSAFLPVLPPVQLAPFAGRFCALHAALLATRRGNVVVCGRRLSGKITTSVLGRRTGNATVLTDELVLVDRSGAVYGVPIPIRERTADSRVSYALEATDVGARLVGVDRVIVLAEGPLRVRQVGSTTEAMRLIAPHVRVLDGALGTATLKLLEVLRRASVWEWRVRPWPGLEDDVVAALDQYVGAGAVSSCEQV